MRHLKMKGFYWLSVILSMAIFLVACITAPTTVDRAPLVTVTTQAMTAPVSSESLVLSAVPSATTVSMVSTAIPPLLATELIKPTSANPITPFGTSNLILGSPLVALIEEDIEGCRSILLVDLGTGISRRLLLDNSEVRSLISWSRSGCELILTSVDIEVIRLDLQGNVLEVLFTPDQYQGEDRILNATVSPTEDWIAYTVGRGQLLYDCYEFQDVMVVSVDGQTGPFELTSQGGAQEVDWSADGQYLAYSDYDATGVLQLYTSRPDGKDYVQLTQFSDPEAEFKVFRWSPDGERIAINYAGGLAIVSVKDKAHPIWFIEGISRMTKFWWYDDDTLATVGYYIDRSQDDEVFGIHWIDAFDGLVIKSLLESKTPGGNMGMPAPFVTPQHIGFFSETSLAHGFYVYNTLTQTFERQIDFERGFIWQWSAAPKAFSGEVMCLP